MTEPVAARVAEYWDARSSNFDDEPDHGLSDPVVRDAWMRRLRSWLPAPPAEVADLGCGTGTLSVLLAGDGYTVRGVDLSRQMIQAARAKAVAAAVNVEFQQADAADPPVAPASVDVVLGRHLLWTLPDPHQALATWTRLLRPGGTLLLIEGHWNQPSSAADTGDTEVAAALPWLGGVGGATLTAAVAPLVHEFAVHDLSGDPRLWGRPVHDERFALVARTARA
ncbi:MAG TPA: class I SAM-dependent methyltransferase [Egicoccus sp.]|nr:class I SAM-dependent methyltransferase [Egicoccus sp.]HSK23715.1 class I SAM-dependent methyltransferase [Egicoccus sp.]